MSRLIRVHSDERGLVVVAVIALVALLFFAGTAMALAVQSNLHSIRTVMDQDAVGYAAQSAVARGVSDSVQSLPGRKPNCQSTGVVNGQALTVDCQDFINVKGSGKRWGSPPQVLNSGNCMHIGLDTLGPPVTFWTVIGRRDLGGASSSLMVWIDNVSNNCSPPSWVSPPKRSGPVYLKFQYAGASKPSLHIKVLGASASFAPVVVRGSKEGSDCLATVVGSAGRMANEADVLVKGCTGSSAPQITLWKSALP